ncbi:mitochondrial distribution and morphology protein [Sporobolomyces koalae]|uniref:mitochondrial distribution and morphology protein n=1 Tax=Sporobolomyces koalae TaxID=500713 RepID=UPI00317EAF22
MGVASRAKPAVRPLYAEIHRYFSRLAPPPVLATAASRTHGSVRTGLGPTLHFRQTGGRGGDGRSVMSTRNFGSSSVPPTRPRSKDPSRESIPTTTTKTLTKPIPHPLSKPYPHYLASLPSSVRRVAASLPSVTTEGRPPTRDQLLSLTTSFFDRLKIRFKWATIRSYRRFRLDDWSAFFSIGIFGTLGWFLLKTTSAFAVLFVLVNSLSSQEFLAKKLGQYLTESTGMKVVFESAIVPKWGIWRSSDDSGTTERGGGGSKIVFKNVYVSRGPVKGELGVLSTAAHEDDAYSHLNKEEREEALEREMRLRELVAQWTHFHLSIDTVEVTLSLRRWLDGKGLVKSAVVKGVRGVVERSHIEYDPDAPTDRYAYRNKPKPGDFHLESLQIEDFLVTIYQPENFRPYTFSIFNADIRKFRKQWLFYDLMSAESITGQVDNCLFSLHRPQSIGRTSEEDLKDARWSRMSRFRIDGVPIDHMQSASDTGVMSWVTSGRLDLVADIRFPRQDTDLDLSALVADLVDDITDRLRDHRDPTGLKNDGRERIPGRGSLTRDALKAPERDRSAINQQRSEKELEERRQALRFKREVKASYHGLDEEEEEELLKKWELEGGDEEDFDDEQDKIVSIDLDLRFKDLKAHVPYFTSNLSYVNNALIRPIVAFINSNRTLIPIHCHIDLGLTEFNGSWTTYDVGILERMSEQVYAALAHHVQSQNDQRIQTVGLWTLQMTANAVLSAFQKNLAPH